MHYVLFVGIFGLPVVVCAGMLVARVLDTFAADEPPEPDRIGNSRLGEIESRVSDLADTSNTAPHRTEPQAIARLIPRRGSRTGRTASWHRVLTDR
jgi:hypothetical protein